MPDPRGPFVLGAGNAPLPTAELSLAAKAIAAGELVAFPTETVYGIAVNARLPHAVQRLFRAKGRPEDKALPLLLADRDDIPRYAAEVPPVAARLMERFWPGPLTIVVLRTDAVCAEAVAGGPTVALRLPDHDLAREIIRRAKVPVAVTSANRSGRPSTVEAARAVAELGPWLRVVVDGGVTGSGLPSTVVDVTVSPPRVLRWGGVSREDLREVLGAVVESTGPQGGH